jgi:histidinol-phosphate aminotransferase
MSLARECIARIAGYIPGEQPQDRKYVKLNTNENPYPPSPRVAAALRAFDPARLRLYSEPLSQELRQVAAAPFGLTADWAIAGNGSDDLLTIATRTFVDQGGRLAYAEPSYSLYPVLADLQGAMRVPVVLDATFDLPADVVQRAGGATLLILCRPNAPTGNAFPLETMHRVCREFSGVVWIDEAYADFADDHCVDFVRQYPNVVVSRTVSKSYSLAGLRLGVAFAQPALVEEMMKVKDSYNLDMLTQALGKAALEDREYMLANVRRIRATRERLCNELRGMGFEIPPSHANFILAKPPVPAAGLFCELRNRGFLARYFDQDRVRDYIRITIGSDPDMAAFSRTVAEILREQGR